MVTPLISFNRGSTRLTVEFTKQDTVFQELSSKLCFACIVLRQIIMMIRSSIKNEQDYFNVSEI